MATTITKEIRVIVRYNDHENYENGIEAVKRDFPNYTIIYRGDPKFDSVDESGEFEVILMPVGMIGV